MVEERNLRNGQERKISYFYFFVSLPVAAKQSEDGCLCGKELLNEK